MLNSAQGQLPFNPQQPQQQPLNVSISNPPWVPPIQVDPALQQYLGVIAGALAVEIQNKAQLNPLRMFMFNQFVQNNYMNAEFQSLVSGVCDYAMVGMMERAYPNLEEAIKDGIIRLAQAYAAVNVRTFPALEGYVDPQMVQEVRQSVAWFDGVAAKIASAKRGASTGMGWGGQQQPAGWGNQQPAGWGQPQANAAWGGRWGGGGQPQASYSSMSGGQRAAGSSGLFVSSGATQLPPGQVGRPTMGSDRWGSGSAQPSFPQSGNVFPAAAAQEALRQPYETKEQQLQTNNEQADQIGTEVPAAGNFSQWAPSAKYPYLPAYNPAKQELYLRNEGNGIIQPILKNKDSQVDYDRHATSNTFGPIPTTVNLNKPEEVLGRIQAGADKLTEAQAKPKDVAQTSVVGTVIKEGTIAETSEAAAILIGSLNRLLAMQDGKMPDAYRACARVAEPIVSLSEENSVVEEYAKANTFFQLRDKLKATAASASPALWNACNNKATAMVNRLLKQNLSLPEWEISNFVLDIEDLINALRVRYGEVIPAALLRHQKDNIDANFQLMYPDIAVRMTQSFLDDNKPAEGAPSPQITYLASDYTFTYLNCLAQELDVELGENHLGVAVKQENTPELHSVLENLFNDARENGGDFDRHLLITNDGHILEAAMGYLAEEAYILTLVK